jgi:hypothetical protein
MQQLVDRKPAARDANEDGACGADRSRFGGAKYTGINAANRDEKQGEKLSRAFHGGDAFPP